MGFRSITQLTADTRVSVVDYATGQAEPDYFTIDSDNVAAAGAGTLTLSLTTVNGAAAGGGDSVELEHDSELWLPANSTIAADGAGTVGKRTIDVDDGANGLPTNLVAVGNYLKFAGHAQIYQVVERIAGAAEYTLRLDPELKAAPADGEAVVVYNIVRLNLPSGVQFQEITSTGASVPVTGVTYAMDAAQTSLKQYALRQLLGITDASITPTVNSTTVTDMKSSVNIQGSTTLDNAVTANEFAGNAGYREVVLPLLLDPDNNSIGVYYEIVTKEGKRVRDLGSLTAAGAAGPVEAASTYNVTISSLLGDFFERWQP